MRFLIFGSMLLLGSASATTSDSVFEMIQSRQSEVVPYDSFEDYRGQNSVIVDGHSFRVLKRSPFIERYPCKNCHEHPSDSSEMQSYQAHWDQKMLHPQFSDSCSLCHGDDKGLKTINGKSISFDHSYKLCAQCHGIQFKDWLWGAHGKRVVGWQAKRVIQNCTGCHNPHDPSFKKRKPATFATYPQR